MNPTQSPADKISSSAPDWIHDLVIYEIATKAFTSPAGPESGTFDSLREKLQYVHDLGVTGIWLTGHSLADATHFYNIWTQYACILPDELDPTLGDAAAFKDLIDCAHELGIKVFLDVITHGVMASSPLIAEKPHWFKGGTWGMVDYDWSGGHRDLDDWWVEVWSSYVEKYGVDGYRLDVATYRPDLWNRIRQRCAAAGHPIVVFAELGPAYAGASDFIQWGERLSLNHGFVQDSPLLTDVASYMQRATAPKTSGFQVVIEYSDGSTASNQGQASFQFALQEAGELEKQQTGPGGVGTYTVRETTLQITGAPVGRQISNITVTHPMYHWPWKISGNTAADFTVTVEGEAPNLRLILPLRLPTGSYLSVQLSCHDNGWDGTPLDQNPYAAQGSRFVFGYAFLLTPAVPLFMAGEEFDADYRPLPQHSPKLFGGELFGQGRWLYASWLDWQQLDERRHAAMLEDVKRLIAIRRRFSHLIRPLRVGHIAAHLLPIGARTDSPAPVPYLYWNSDECLLVAGNPNPAAELSIHFTLPVEVLGWEAGTQFTVTDLWHDVAEQVIDAENFAKMTHTLRSDKTPRGGLLVLHLQRHR